MSDQQNPGDNKPINMSPHSVEAEEAVLGSILINAESLFEVASFLQGDDFFLIQHKWIWEAILAVSERNHGIDYVSVTQELRDQGHLEEIGGPGRITYLINNTPTHLHATTYGRLVEAAAIRRRLLSAAGDIAKVALEEDAEITEVLDKAESTLFSATEGRLRKDIVPIRQAVSEYFDRIEYLYNHQDEPLGVPSGFTDLDKLLGGFQRSDLIIVAARPGVGKTSFMLSVALNAARLGSARVAIFSLEMSTEQIIQRLVSSETQINQQKLRLGNIDEREWSLLVESTSRLSKLKIFIDDTPGISTLQMRTKCRRLYREHGLDLVIVDYLQLMKSDKARSDNRVQEISDISRGLKEMAKELNVPVISAAQLSRAVEQRSDKRPQLSDLRESGCLAGDTLIYRPDRGTYAPIRSFLGQTDTQIASLDIETLKIEPQSVINAFYTGCKPVYRLITGLGQTLRATGNHQFLTINGWKRLDTLSMTDRIATPRVLKSTCEQTMSNAELAFLGHLIGDGCTLPHHSMQYTTREYDLAESVCNLASQIFAERIKPRIVQKREWYQVYFPTTRHLTHGIKNPITVWLDDLGVMGLRSYEKKIPEKVFNQPNCSVALFLSHLWATDGCINFKSGYPIVYYATSSPQLAWDVHALLLRLNITARLRIVSQSIKGRDQYHIIVSGNQDLIQFAEKVNAVGEYRKGNLAKVREYLDSHISNTNRDTIPNSIWRKLVVPAMQRKGLTARQMQSQLETAYCGTGLYKQNISRERAARLASIVECDEIQKLAESDIYWDSIVSIVPDGETDVYDLTVPPHANFIANNIIVHNSIEQDADIVTFLYREELYDPNTERANQADVIVAKHRNGPTDTITLFFRKELTQFANMSKSTFSTEDF
jgi:replicative DNA helicase